MAETGDQHHDEIATGGATAQVATPKRAHGDGREFGADSSPVRWAGIWAAGSSASSASGHLSKREIAQGGLLQVRDENETVLAAVRCCGLALRNSSAACRASWEIVAEAVKQDGEALRYAADACKKDHQIVALAVQQCPTALQYAAEECRAHRGIVMEAVRQDEKALQYAASELLLDETFAVEAKQRHYILAISALSGRTCCIALHRTIDHHQCDVDLNVCLLHQSCETLGIQYGCSHDAMLLHESERVCSGTLLRSWPGCPGLGKVTKYQLLVTPRRNGEWDDGLHD